MLFVTLLLIVHLIKHYTIKKIHFGRCRMGENCQKIREVGMGLVFVNTFFGSFHANKFS